MASFFFGAGFAALRGAGRAAFFATFAGAFLGGAFFGAAFFGAGFFAAWMAFFGAGFFAGAFAFAGFFCVRDLAAMFPSMVAMAARTVAPGPGTHLGCSDVSRPSDSRDRKALRTRLEPAYLSTRYVVDAVPEVLAEPLTIRIGEQHPQLDALGVGSGWLFITAWNPGGKPAPAADNARALRKLEQRLVSLGQQHFRGRGVGADPTWTPEESFLVLDVSRALARRLGEEMEQLAVVIGAAGEPAELLWLEGDEPERPRGRCR